MPEVVGSVAIVEGQAAAAAQATNAPLSFVDGAEGSDPAAAILDEVLAGTPATEEVPADDDKTPADKPAEAKPVETPPAKEEPPANDVEAARLRKGYAKLAEERQRLVELQNTARAEKASAQQFAEKARKHDDLIASIEKDPAAFLQAHGGEALVQKALQGFIDMEKSPAEREVAKFRAEQAERDKIATQRETERTAANWRNEQIAKVQADERFDLINTLGLHGDVIDVMTRYFDKHSERDDKGNVVKPAILTWDIAAQAVEDQRAAMIEKSKRYGKRTPTAAEGTPEAKKDAPAAKPAIASAKKAPTSLSSVPVAETPSSEDDLPTTDNDERERQLLAQLGL